MKKKLFKLAILGALTSTASVVIAQDNLGDVLPNAKPGECYAQVVIPAKYRTESSTLVVREASESVKIVPAKYENVEERVMVSEAASDLKMIPATFGTTTERYEISPASSRWVMSTANGQIGADSQLVSMARSAGAGVDSAKAGQCFSEHFSAPTYKSVTERVLVSDAAQTIKLTPAKYEWVEQRVMVAPAARKLVEIPAVYENKQERVMVEAAKTEWKAGRGAIEKIDNGTGEVMCLVEIPAVFKTVNKRVLKTAAATRTTEEPARYETIRVRKLVADAQESRVAIPAKYDSVTKRVLESNGSHSWVAKGARNAGTPTGNVICLQASPAEYGTISRKVVKTPASVQRVEIPAKYETKRVRRLVEPAREVRTAIPAQTDDVTRRVQISPERLEWRSVICETNVNVNTIQDVQRALKKSGYNPGPIDGIMGRQTMDAVKRFQQSRNLAVGGVTTETLKKLGVQH